MIIDGLTSTDVISSIIVQYQVQYFRRARIRSFFHNKINTIQINPTRVIKPTVYNFIMMNKLSFLFLSLCVTSLGLVQAFAPNNNNNNNNINNSIKRNAVVAQLAPFDFDAIGSSFQTIADAAAAVVDTTAVVDTASAVVDTTTSADYIPGTSGEVTYSKASYYAILGLYLTSFPGLWSTIKRSTKTKVKRKTYVSKGVNAEVPEGEKGQGLREQAGEIMAYMKANNYEVVDAGETIKFQGLVQRSVSQACFLVFCSFVGLASLALVLSIQFNTLELPVIGTPNWYFMCLLSPYAGIYYWRAGDRIDDFSIKLETNDEETENSINVQGSEDEIERMWRALEWQEKGMVKVPGMLGE